MDALDPRHGTMRGHAQGCRDICCRRAKARYEKGRRYNAATGRILAIPALGTQRRIQALMAIGWTTTDIAHAAGWTHRNRVRQILEGQKGKPTTWVTRATDQRIRALYEQLSMTLPEMTGPRRRSRTMALRLGYAPPLAYDDIDDPDEQPRGLRTHHAPESRADIIADVIERGGNHYEAARVLGISTNALEKWCDRRGMRAEFNVLRGRAHVEDKYRSKGDAA